MKPRVGISSCLLGQEVRYDGGHKRDPWITRTLARNVTFVPVCPEVEVGMGVPREPIHLERAAGEDRLVSRSGIDYTRRMRRYAEARVKALERLGLSGYILKAKSPSCGMERVKVLGLTRTSRGAFAAVLLDRLPDLPVVDEGRLADPRVRERFLARVQARHRLHQFFGRRWSPKGLARFHAVESRRLAPPARTALARVAASAASRPRGLTASVYTSAFMKAFPGSPET